MNASRRILVAAGSVAFLLSVWIGSTFTPLDELARSAGAEPTSGTKLVSAAEAFIASLEPEKKSRATFAFDDKERINWHFIPRERKGLPVKDLSESQREKASALLAAGLSKVGAATVEDVRGLESVLAAIEGPDRRFPRDPDLYFVSVFGTPAATGRWGWRFEGHHLCVNFTLDGETVLSATPLFFGANPALVKDGPKKGLRVLATLEDVARDLVKSLSAEQLAKARAEGKPVEVGGTESKEVGALPEGITVRDLEKEQRQTLRKLINQYTRYLAPDVRKAIADEIKEGGFGKVQFAWRGGLESGEGHSYVVHGPTFAIAYANFQNDAMHVHAGLRDTKGEFGE